MSDLQEYLGSLGSNVLWHCYRRGDARDLSGNARHGVITGGEWRQTKGGRGYNSGAGTAGGIVVADSGAGDPLRITGAITLIAFFHNKIMPADFIIPVTAGGQPRVLLKRDVGGTNYDLFFDAASNFLALYDGVNVPTFTFSVRAQMFATTVAGGTTIPKQYLDGALAGSFTGIVNIVADDANLSLLSYYPASYGYEVKSPCADMMVFNAELTATQIGLIWEKWNQAATPDLIDKRRLILPVSKNLKASCVMHLDTSQIAGATVPDLSGYGNIGTITQPVNQAEGIFDRALEMHGANAGAGRVVVANSASIQTMPIISISAWIRPDSSGGGTVGTILNKGPWAISNYAGLAWYSMQDYAGGGGTVITWPLNAAYGIPYHLAITYDKTLPANTPLVYVNGTAVATTRLATGVGALPTDAAYALTVGASATGTTGHDGLVEDVRLYNEILTPTEVRALYLEGARKPTIYTPRFAYPVSTAYATSGQRCGPWTLGAGASYSYEDDGTRRRIFARNAGTRAYIKQPYAFGTWYIRMTRKAGSQAWLQFAVSAPDTSPGGAGSNGYGFVMDVGGKIEFYELPAGTLPFYGGTFSADVEYELLITRSVAGVFTLYARGGVYTVWTKLVADLAGSNPFTNTVHTTSCYANVQDQLAGSSWCNFRHYVGDMTPAEFDAMGLSE